MRTNFCETEFLNYNRKMWKSLQYAKRQKAIKIILWPCYCQFMSQSWQWMCPSPRREIVKRNERETVPEREGDSKGIKQTKHSTNYYGRYSRWCGVEWGTKDWKARNEKKTNNALANYLKICSQTVKSRVTLLNNVDVACVLRQIPLNNKCERVFNVNGLAYSNTLCWNQKRAICKHIIGMAGGKGCEKYNKKWERERESEQ